jgi:hypothetical protein
MTQYHISGFNITVTNSGTSAAEMRFTSTSYKSTSNAIYKYGSPQSTTGGGFTLSFEIKISKGSSGDAIYAFIGQSSVPSKESPTGVGTGMIIAFDVYKSHPSGIYLTQTSSGASTNLVYYSTFSASGYWEPVVIVYTPSATDTWQVCSHIACSTY